MSLFWDEANHRLDRDERRMLAGYARLGLARLIAFPSLWGLELEVLDRFADDCRATGVSLDGQVEGEARIASAEQT